MSWEPRRSVVGRLQATSWWHELCNCSSNSVFPHDTVRACQRKRKSKLSVLTSGVFVAYEERCELIIRWEWREGGDIPWLPHFYRQSCISVSLDLPTKMLPLLLVAQAPHIFRFLPHSWLLVRIVFQQDSNSSHINREYSRVCFGNVNKCVSCGLLGLQVIALKIQNTLYITGWRLCHISALDFLQAEHDLHKPTTKIFCNVRLTTAERAASSVALQHRCLPLYGAKSLDETRQAKCV